jgi:hypothetical protein
MACGIPIHTRITVSEQVKLVSNPFYADLLPVALARAIPKTTMQSTYFLEKHRITLSFGKSQEWQKEQLSTVIENTMTQLYI